MECSICHQDKDETLMTRCPLCHQYACEACKFTRGGRSFCSRFCGETFFFEDEEGED